MRAACPGSLVTYEPQWGSDVFGMYQSMVEGRAVPRALLTKDFPKNKHDDLEHLVDALDWDKNVDPNFKDNNYLEPINIGDTSGAGYQDRWVVYGRVDGKQLFSARELTVMPGAKMHDQGRSGQRLDYDSGPWSDRQAGVANAGDDPLRRDDGRRSLHHARAATEGVEVENTGTEPLVGLHTSARTPSRIQCCRRLGTSRRSQQPARKRSGSCSRVIPTET